MGDREPLAAPVVVEPLRDDDVDRCAELETILFPGDNPWPASAFTAELAEKHIRLFAAREPGSPLLVGYAAIGLLGNSFFPESEVHTIGVDPRFQRRGIGYALLRALLDAADRHGGPVFLEVRTDNDAAQQLYQRNGFATVGVRKNYYRPSGADAYTMKREAVR